MTTRIRIRSALQPGILDPETRTILQQLQATGHTDLKDATKEIHFILNIDAEPESALAQARKMAKTVLCNPVIHTWSVELEAKS